MAGRRASAMAGASSPSARTHAAARRARVLLLDCAWSRRMRFEALRVGIDLPAGALDRRRSRWAPACRRTPARTSGGDPFGLAPEDAFLGGEVLRHQRGVVARPFEEEVRDLALARAVRVVCRGAPV